MFSKTQDLNPECNEGSIPIVLLGVLRTGICFQSHVIIVGTFPVQCKDFHSPKYEIVKKINKQKDSKGKSLGNSSTEMCC